MAVGVEDSRIEGELTGLVTVDVHIDITSPGGHGDQAATFQLGQRGPFSQDARWVGASSSGSSSARVVVSLTWHRRREPPALRAGRKSGGASRWVTCRCRLSRCRPAQAEDHGIELSLEGLVQPGLNIAPDRGHLDIGTQVQQLGTPANELVPICDPAGRACRV